MPELLQQTLKKYRLILASKSPRRQDLLKGLDLDFTIQSINVKETYKQDLQKEAIPIFLASIKADAAINNLKSNDILITADTIVWANNTAFNKPKTKADAVAMLKILSGNTHSVITAVQLTSINKKYSFFSETKVHFSSLSNDEINYYIEHYQPFDKAGAYGIQEWIGYIGIEKIEGSYFNVMGLPVHQLYAALKIFIN